MAKLLHEDEYNALIADRERLEWLDEQGIRYGVEDLHTGTQWCIDGAYANLREAIDRARGVA